MISYSNLGIVIGMSCFAVFVIVFVGFIVYGQYKQKKLTGRGEVVSMSHPSVVGSTPPIVLTQNQV